MPLDNCKRCGRLFQKTNHPVCSGCYTFEQNQNMEIYRYIQENPGVTLDELADRFHMPLKEIETLIFSGALGTANQLVKSYCALCKCEMSQVNRVGHFCYKCNNSFEKEAGLEKLSVSEQRIQNILNGHSAFYKPLPEDITPDKTSKMGPPKPVNTRSAEAHIKQDSSSSAKFGFKRISGA